jgi:hypothetical protein
MEIKRWGKNYRYKKPLPIGVSYSIKSRAFIVRVLINNRITSIAKFKKEQEAINYYQNYVTSN